MNPFILITVPYCPRHSGSVPEPGMDLGYAINQIMERLAPNDWAFLLDHDLTWFTDYRPFLLSAIKAQPDAGFFTCYRYPASKRKPWLQPHEITRRTYDLRYHKAVAKQLAYSYGNELQDVTKWEKLPGGSPGAALFLLSKRAWARVGGFKPGFKKEGIDYDFHVRIREAGMRAYLMKSVYCYHAKEL